MNKKVHTLLLRRCRHKFPYLHTLIKSNGPVGLERKHTDHLFEYLVKTVVGQQLSNAAASTIAGRIQTSAKQSRKSLLNFCVDSNYDCLKQAGLSRYKVKAILGLRTAFHNKEIDIEALESGDYDYIASEITKLWGFGVWSADMIAMNFFALEDVWSEHDVTLVKGLGIIAEKEMVEECEILQIVTPYRSYFAQHVWLGIDDKKIP